MNEKRIALLNHVLKAEIGFQDSIKELSLYDWDYVGSPAILDKGIIKDILTRYIAGQLDTAAIYEWADFIELREDIDYPEQEDAIISEILHILANPALEGELTRERAEFLLSGVAGMA